MKTGVESDMLFQTHRYLNPATGRFLTRDPIGMEDGVNLYASVGNGVVVRTDRTWCSRIRSMFAGYPSDALCALGMSYAAACIGFCFSIAGFVIALLSHKAWRTRYKPRWPGILLLVGGLYLLIAGIIGAWQIRQEVIRRRASENATGRNIARMDIIWYEVSNVLTIRGVYDGKTIRPLEQVCYSYQKERG